MFEKLNSTIKKLSSIILTMPTVASAGTQGPSLIEDPNHVPTQMNDVEELILRAQDIVFAAAGGVAVAMIVWGAIILVTAGGNEERTGKGKKTLTYGIGGIIFIVSAYTIITVYIRILGGGVEG